MPGKMTKSILRPPFRPPRYRQPSAARVYLAGRSEKRKIFTSAPESSGESRLIFVAQLPLARKEHSGRLLTAAPFSRLWRYPLTVLTPE